ncbi:sensor histidine kinase [Pseudoalteromonas fenneropenaei]|uniref:histidine kinase n=1 Tax=Pseudoalteromonas fenneropenaei TaxID=1737459 RepID=A0ABV7CGE2_9GAMM
MRHSLMTKLHVITLLAIALVLIPILWILDWTVLEKLLLVIAAFSLSVILVHSLSQDLRDGLAALELGLLNFKDGEFASQLAYDKDDEFGHLCQLYNSTAGQLRAEKQWLYQRELMLDKVLQSAPQVLMLVNSNEQVVFSNLAARELFRCPSRLEGMQFDTLFDAAPAGLQAVLSHKRDGLFSLQPEHSETQTWHLTTGAFLLNNQHHTLFILKQMTRELSRQEVMVWKKVIRVISHELNNSLGPISSMLHSGKILTEGLNDNRLTRVFATIDERIKHLTEFVHGYGKFAKLPQPKLSQIAWLQFAKALSAHWQFQYDLQCEATLTADRVQLEQLLINLLKNAHESGSALDQIVIKLSKQGQHVQLDVLDRGKGMSEQVMANALVPFYSTKATGSGLGLALCREIVEAHHGQISLYNRDGGGLGVRVQLPVFVQES